MLAFLKRIFSAENIAGDVRNVVITLMTVGAISMLSAFLAALVKAIRQEPIPWIIFLGLVVLGTCLFVAAVLILLRKERQQTTQEFLAPSLGAQTKDAAKFETFEPQIKYQEVIRKFEFSIGFRNTGEVDATDIDCGLWMADSSLRQHQSAMDVSPGAHRFLNVTFGITKPRIDPVFAVFTISYRSGQEQDRREQTFYYKWYGIRNEVTNTTLDIVSRDDRAKIDLRIKNEASGIPLKPIEIRNSLDQLIQDANDLIAEWKMSQDAIGTANMQDMAVSWIREAQEFVSRNLETRHVDQLRDYGQTLTPGDRYKITFELENAGLAWQRFPAAHELASKSQVLTYFRLEIV